MNTDNLVKRRVDQSDTFNELTRSNCCRSPTYVWRSMIEYNCFYWKTGHVTTLWETTSVRKSDFHDTICLHTITTSSLSDRFNTCKRINQWADSCTIIEFVHDKNAYGNEPVNCDNVQLYDNLTDELFARKTHFAWPVNHMHDTLDQLEQLTHPNIIRKDRSLRIQQPSHVSV